uniref:Uncharacterized protein n=1 Tax=Romanomermis culicivorax TaxID=13658 RepID=A0A915L3Y1_ROMCU
MVPVKRINHLIEDIGIMDTKKWKEQFLMGYDYRPVGARVATATGPFFVENAIIGFSTKGYSMNAVIIQKNYPVCKQTNFSDSLLKGVFDYREFNRCDHLTQKINLRAYVRYCVLKIYPILDQWMGHNLLWDILV